MRASILLSHPFLIPRGTKLELKNNASGTVHTVFFAGYKTFGRGLLVDHYDLFPAFRDISKDGRMCNRAPKGWTSTSLGATGLEHFSLTILELPAEGLYTANRENRFNDRLSNLVAVCTAEMLDTARRKGVVSVVFKDHPEVEAPYATFNDDGGYAWCPVTELVFNFDENQIIVRGDDHGTVWMGYLDDSWGDYFDVGQSFGHIYKAFMKAVPK